MINPFFQELDFLVHQVIDSPKLRFDQGRGCFYLRDIFFYTLQIRVQLLEEKSNSNSSIDNKEPKKISGLNIISMTKTY